MSDVNPGWAREVVTGPSIQNGLEHRELEGETLISSTAHVVLD